MISLVATAALVATGALAASPITLPLQLKHGLASQGPVYLVNISVGTPPQQVTVQIDTGSSDLWIFDKGVNCGNTLGCVGGTYDKSASSSYAADLPGRLDWSYGSGSSGNGDYIREDIHIGGATAKGVRIGLTTNTTGDESLWGLMGLGFPAGEFLVEQGHPEDQYPLLVEELAAQGQIDAAAFSIYLNDVHSDGHIVFGGYDKAKFTGELTAVDVLSFDNEYSSWYVNLTALGTTFDGETYWHNNESVAGAAFIDSGAPKAFLPGSSAVGAIMSVGGQWNGDVGQSIIACSAISDTETTIDFALGPNDAVVVHVPVSELVDPFPGEEPPMINGEVACSFGVGPGPDGFQVLGDGFMRGAYIVFNMETKKVSFAPAKYNATESNVVAITKN